MQLDFIQHATAKLVPVHPTKRVLLFGKPFHHFRQMSIPSLLLVFIWKQRNVLIRVAVCQLVDADISR